MYMITVAVLIMPDTATAVDNSNVSLKLEVNGSAIFTTTARDFAHSFTTIEELSQEDFIGVKISNSSFTNSSQATVYAHGTRLTITEL